MPVIRPALLKWFSVVLLLLLVACGGGSSNSTGSASNTGTADNTGGNGNSDINSDAGDKDFSGLNMTEPKNPATGDWHSGERVNKLTVADINAGLGEVEYGEPIGFAAIYSVDAYRITYYTTDGLGRKVLASGLLALPQKGGLASPVLSFQHGTIYQDAEAPSNHAVAIEPAVFMASQGYIALSADYVGYGATKGLAHPYLLAEPSAASVVDFIQAVSKWMQAMQVAHNSQLFLTGYSEGGYVTMAAHRFLQANNPTGLMLVASVPAAGPYNLTATLDELVRRKGVDPNYLSLIPASLRTQLRDHLLKDMLKNEADVVFDTTFMDNYLAGKRDVLARDSNVYDWKPEIPVRLHHGVDDDVVPYVSATSTLAAMLARGANVALVDCTANPSTHTGCIPSYVEFMVGYFSTQARDL